MMFGLNLDDYFRLTTLDKINCWSSSTALFELNDSFVLLGFQLTVEVLVACLYSHALSDILPQNDLVFDISLFRAQGRALRMVSGQSSLSMGYGAGMEVITKI